MIDQTKLENLEKHLLEAIHFIDSMLADYAMNEKQTLQQPGYFLDPLANQLESIQSEIQQAWINVGHLKKRGIEH